jgi:hypothetical protein
MLAGRLENKHQKRNNHEKNYEAPLAIDISNGTYGRRTINILLVSRKHMMATGSWSLINLCQR